MWTELAYAFGVWVCQFLTHGLAQQLMIISMSRNVDHQCKDCRLDIEVGVTCVPSLQRYFSHQPCQHRSWTGHSKRIEKGWIIYPQVSGCSLGDSQKNRLALHSGKGTQGKNHYPIVDHDSILSIINKDCRTRLLLCICFIIVYCLYVDVNSSNFSVWNRKREIKRCSWKHAPAVGWGVT